VAPRPHGARTDSSNSLDKANVRRCVEIRCGMARLIRTFHNAKNEEVGRLTFEEKDERLHLKSAAPPGIDRRFRTERGAANWWESNVDPETGKIRR
jgi:hypothetical protein